MTSLGGRGAFVAIEQNYDESYINQCFDRSYCMPPEFIFAFTVEIKENPYKDDDDDDDDMIYKRKLEESGNICIFVDGIEQCCLSDGESNTCDSVYGGFICSPEDLFCFDDKNVNNGECPPNESCCMPPDQFGVGVCQVDCPLERQYECRFVEELVPLDEYYEDEYYYDG